MVVILERKQKEDIVGEGSGCGGGGEKQGLRRREKGRGSHGWEAGESL